MKLVKKIEQGEDQTVAFCCYKISPKDVNVYLYRYKHYFISFYFYFFIIKFYRINKNWNFFIHLIKHN